MVSHFRSMIRVPAAGWLYPPCRRTGHGGSRRAGRGARWLAQNAPATLQRYLQVRPYARECPVCTPVRFAVYPWIATVTQGRIDSVEGLPAPRASAAPLRVGVASATECGPAPLLVRAWSYLPFQYALSLSGSSGEWRGGERLAPGWGSAWYRPSWCRCCWCWGSGKCRGGDCWRWYCGERCGCCDAIPRGWGKARVWG